MKIVFIKCAPGYETDLFTKNKVYDVIYESSNAVRVHDNLGKENWVFKNEYVELEEYKSILVKKRFEEQLRWCLLNSKKVILVVLLLIKYMT